MAPLPAHAAVTADPVSVQLLGITDFHGYLNPPRPGDDGVIPGPGGDLVTVGGAAYLATHVQRLRAGRPNSLLYASGDAFSGWPFEVAAHANEPTVEVLNALGVRFSALGNHELDVSPSFLIDHMENGACFGTIGRDSCFTDSTGARFHGADFDYQSGNIVYADSGKPVVSPYHVEWVADDAGRLFPVGFIGMTVPSTPVGSTSYQPTLRALDIVESTNKYAAELVARGVRAIVLNMHEGAQPQSGAGAPYDNCDNVAGPAVDIARQVSSDVDVVVTGHWHAHFNCMIDDPAGVPRPVVEAGNHGSLINEIDLSLDPGTGEVVRERTRSVNHPVTRDVVADPAMQRIVDYWNAQGSSRYLSELAQQTGDFLRTPNEAGESTAADLFADVQYWEADRTPAGKPDLALVADPPGPAESAIGGDLLYAKGPHPQDADGRILFGEAWDAYGYGNPVLVVTVTGARLKAILEQQWRTADDGTEFRVPLAVSRNASYSYDPTRALGNRIANVVVDGASLVPTRSYRVAALAYTALGNDGFSFGDFTNAVRGNTDRTAFTAYLRAHPVLSPAPLQRVHIESAARTGA
ncbi:bifunctional metallophosphatase/5'-nucleotidase [Streptomyces sp. SID3343]|nr:bifunctional metallophosphatase/5'-nucleotidase [Streptomyces sp. SID3343]MYW04944.1 bifunctional metallophosphatase/5'-nucleotidase [Streptomyces sp. SID3343]